MSLLTYLDPEEADLFPESAAWRDRIVARVDDDLAARARTVPHALFRVLLGWATTTPCPRDAAAFVDHVRATSPADVAFALAGGRGSPGTEGVRRAELRAAVRGTARQREDLAGEWLGLSDAAGRTVA